MSHFVRSAITLLACAGVVGAASAAAPSSPPPISHHPIIIPRHVIIPRHAATYSWPLAVSVPVTVNYPNPPAGFTVQLRCDLNPSLLGGLGEAIVNVPISLSGAYAWYKGTMLLSVAKWSNSSRQPTTGDKIWCYLQPLVNGVVDRTQLGGDTVVSRTLP